MVRIAEGYRRLKWPLAGVVVVLTILATLTYPNYAGRRAKEARKDPGKLITQAQSRGPSPGSDRTAALVAAGMFALAVGGFVCLLRPKSSARGLPLLTAQSKEEADDPHEVYTVHLRRDLNGRFGFVHIG
eukprot:Hpha_TRINITY_DN25035_c0_g1::TRINITY_DN25035_c0_g1_i1::g.109709::m.109709